MNISSVIINFKAPSLSSDILCPDGEVENDDRWFISPEDDDNDDNSSDSDSNTSSVSNKNLIPLPNFNDVSLGEFPSGARLLGSSLLSPSVTGLESPLSLLIARLPDGSPASFNLSSPSPLIFEGSGDPLPPNVRLVSCGRFLLFCDGFQPRFSFYNGVNFSWPCKLPSPLLPIFNLLPASLPGYCDIPGDLPMASLSIPCPSSIEAEVADWLSDSPRSSSDFYNSSFVNLRNDIEKLLRSWWVDYLTDASRAGLIVCPEYATVAIAFSDSPSSELFALSDASLLNTFEADSPTIQFRIASFRIANGVLELSVRVSAKPFKISCNVASPLDGYIVCLLSGPLKHLSNSSSFRGLSNLPPIDGDDNRCRGWSVSLSDSDTTISFNNALNGNISSQKESWHIADIRQVKMGNVNFIFPCLNSNIIRDVNRSGRHPFNANGGLFFNSRLIIYGPDGLRVSEVGPKLSEFMACPYEGFDISDLAASMKSLSSGQLGDFPLYSFSHDGIRILSPDDSFGFRSIQLICRESIVDGSSVASTLNGVAFITDRGVVTLEGSSTSSLGFPSDDRSPVSLHWHYPSNSLIALSSNGIADAYSFSDKKWHPLSPTEVSANNLPVNTPSPSTTSSVASSPATSTVASPAASSVAIIDFCEAWPKLFAVLVNHIVEVGTSLVDVSPKITAGIRPPSVNTVYTRPIKLGSPFSKKFVVSVVLSPDAPLISCELQGSNDLKHWYPLARGSYHLHPNPGSGWLFLRLRLSLPPEASHLPSSLHLTTHP